MCRFTMGFVFLFRKVNGNDYCSWCHYLSCVPTPLWSCDPLCNVRFFLGLVRLFVIRLIETNFFWYFYGFLVNTIRQPTKFDMPRQWKVEVVYTSGRLWCYLGSRTLFKAVHLKYTLTYRTVRKKKVRSSLLVYRYI